MTDEPNQYEKKPSNTILNVFIVWIAIQLVAYGFFIGSVLYDSSKGECDARNRDPLPRISVFFTAVTPVATFLVIENAEVDDKICKDLGEEKL